MKICLLSCFLINDDIISFLNELKTILNKNGFELVVLSLKFEPSLDAPSIVLPYLFKDYDKSFLEQDDSAIPLDDYMDDLIKTDIIFSNDEENTFDKHYKGYCRCRITLDKIISSLNPSIGFVWGKSHPQSRLLGKLLENRKIPAFFFERGMFADTFMIEPLYSDSVSCMNDTAIWKEWLNISDYDHIYDQVKDYYIKNKPQKYSQNDYLPPEELRESLNLKGKQVVVFWGQHDVWSGIIPRETHRSLELSPFFTSSKDALNNLYEVIDNIPEISLIFKPHPHDKNSYNDFKNESILIARDINNYSLFGLADVFVSMLTTTQFESLFYEKPIILLANSQLKDKGIAYEFENGKKLDKLLKQALNREGYKGKLLNSKKLVSGLFEDFLYGYHSNIPTKNKVSEFSHFINDNAIDEKNNMDLESIRSHVDEIVSLFDKKESLNGIDPSRPPEDKHNICTQSFDVPYSNQRKKSSTEQATRLIAFYLPQYHPIPENDQWWGEGFTEWTNVAKTKPLFPGHYQPHIPSDLGYYDLRNKDDRERQTQLAKEYCVDGFCYWHYWFKGKRLLEHPFQSVLNSGEPDFPFCLAWANETWSRRWLGEEKDILIKQEYSEEDDINHALWLISAFNDRRYIKVDNRPMFMIYRPKDLPDPQKTVETIRQTCFKHGIENPYLVGIDAHCMNFDCRLLGFDDTLSFMPQLSYLPEFMNDDASESKRQRNLKLGVDSANLKLYDYEEAMDAMLSGLNKIEHPVIPSLFVGWDNTPRRGQNGIIITNASPEKFGHSLRSLVDNVQNRPVQQRFVFLNAWNEWGEGNHLEPDIKYEHRFLEEVKKAKSYCKISQIEVEHSVNNQEESGTKAIAFYLPQYHPVPENDQWWGKGFTEWTNVAKAKPLFPGHYQPHVPSDLGFYDLRLPEVRKAQADMARQYGISGFCYYHYWFNGKRLLNRVFDEVMVTGKPDFPFCLCWANENWTRAWDGGDSEILVGQKYSRQDDLDHIKWLIQAFRDPRYIKIYGKPLLLIYRAGDLPDSTNTAVLWREEVIKAGFPDLYLCKIESFTDEHSDPVESGFDASVEFQPDWTNLGNKSPQYDNINVFNYTDIVDRMIHKPDPGYMRFPCVTPSWDNSPRRGKDGYIFHNSNPVIYEKWLRHAISTVGNHKPEEKIVFINAWNEWGEGNHLEPDIKSGHAYLHATKRAITIDNQRAMLNEIVTQRAAIALESGDLNEAKKLILRSLSNDDSASKTLHQYALILFNEGDIENSSKILLKAIEIDPFNSELLNDLGAVYHAASEISKAKKHFEKALEINPHDITTLKNLTELLINEGKFNVASDKCAILKSLAPGDKDVASFLSLINEKYKVEDSTVDYEKSIDDSLRTINIATKIKNTNKQAESFPANPLLQNSKLYEFLLDEKPKFHNDAQGNPISWNTNTRLLNFLDTYLKPGMCTLETGSGYSTVLFIGKKCFHTAISPAQSEFDRISDFCKKHNLPLADVTFIAGNSTDHLPLLNEDNLDVLFIDGAHRFPFPVIDWFYGTKILRQGGIAIIDDTDIISCFILQSFLAQDDHWETVLIEKDFSIFRKLDGHDYPGDWPDQVFSKNKISDAETFLKAFYEIPLDPSDLKNDITETKYIKAGFPTQETDISINKLDANEKSMTNNNELDSKDIDMVSEVPVDWTPAFDYEALTFDEIEEYSNIEVTEELREGGVHAQKAWDYWFQYLSKNIWKTSLHSEIVSFCNSLDNPRILSLGCGYGGVELEVARNLKKPYHMTAVDLNGQLFTKARKEAEVNAFDIRFIASDLNFVKIREESFDLIFAHASLHHLLNLEHVFLQIYKGLKENGRLIIQDIIGKTQILFWKENVDKAIEIVKNMPPQYKKDIPSNHPIIPPYVEPSDQKGMEGIRQEEIPEMLESFFSPVKVFSYGSFMRLICTHPVLGKRLDPDNSTDRKYLEQLFNNDLDQIEQKKLRPTEMLGVYQKRPSIDIDTIHTKANIRLCELLIKQGKTSQAFELLKGAAGLDTGKLSESGIPEYNTGEFTKPQLADSDTIHQECLSHGTLEESEQHLKDALYRSPSDPHILHQYGLVLFQQGKITDAIENLILALEKDSYNAEIHNDIGAMYHASGDLSKAQYNFEKALEIKPDDITSLKNLTELYIFKKQLENARTICNRLKSLYPDDKEADILWNNIHTQLEDQADLNTANSIERNRNQWSNYDWSSGGDEWSSLWGGTENLWEKTILPRIKPIIPAEHILEIAPGFGRCTQFLAPQCQKLSIVDLTEKCIEACKQRFKNSQHISYFVNDGKSLHMIDDNSIDFVFSWDSLVHVEKNVMKSYLHDLAAKLKPGGMGFLHHSNIGSFKDPVTGKLTVENNHWRGESMSAELFREYCKNEGIQCLSQEIIAWGCNVLNDCFSTFIKNKKDDQFETIILENPDFMSEARGTKTSPDIYMHLYHPVAESNFHNSSQIIESQENQYTKEHTGETKTENKNDSSFSDSSYLISIILTLRSTGTQNIKSILKNVPDQGVELIIVDNASNNNLKDYLDRLNRKNLTLIAPEVVSTDVEASMLGAGKASGTYLMFIDSSVPATKTLFQDIISILEKSADLNAMVGKTIDKQKTIIEAGATIICESMLKSRGEGVPFYEPAFSFVSDVGSGSRYCMIIRKTIWEEVGRFNNDYKSIGAALIDLGMKITSRGYRIQYRPQCILISDYADINDSSSEDKSYPDPEILVALRPKDFPIDLVHSNDTEHKNILVLGIYLANKMNNISDIVSVLNRSKIHTVVQKWVALNGSPPDAHVENVTVKQITGRSPKFQIINELLQKEDLSNFDYVIICDDDIILPQNFIDSYITLHSKLGFAIAQPARTVNSYIDHPIVEKHTGVHARQTQFVEIGPVTSFHQSAYDFIFPFDLTSPMGWGYENVWAYEITRRYLKMGIIDGVCVDHSLRKPVANYEWDQADRERSAYLSKHEHIPLEECFRVINTHIFSKDSI